MIRSTINGVLLKLAKYSEVRGKDSSGIAIRQEENKNFEVFKGSMPISELIESQKIIANLEDTFNVKKDISKNSKNIAVFGHARLTTNGTQLEDENNQPVIKDGLIGIHNGIIVNVDELWDLNKDLKGAMILIQKLCYRYSESI